MVDNTITAAAEKATAHLKEGLILIRLITEQLEKDAIEYVDFRLINDKDAQKNTPCTYLFENLRIKQSNDIRIYHGENSATVYDFGKGKYQLIELESGFQLNGLKDLPKEFRGVPIGVSPFTPGGITSPGVHKRPKLTPLTTKLVYEEARHVSEHINRNEELPTTDESIADTIANRVGKELTDNNGVSPPNLNLRDMARGALVAHITEHLNTLKKECADITRSQTPGEQRGALGLFSFSSSPMNKNRPKATYFLPRRQLLVKTNKIDGLQSIIKAILSGKSVREARDEAMNQNEDLLHGNIAFFNRCRTDKALINAMKEESRALSA
jgi:hypothetical protein